MRAYCSVDEIQDALPDVTWGTAYDTLLAALALRASRAIDRFTGREAGAYCVEADSTRYFDGSGGTEQWIDELAALPTTVAVAETGEVDGTDGTGGSYTTWASTDYLVWPRNAPAEGRPILRLDIGLNGNKAAWPAYPKSVKITGKWGYATTPPADVVQATIIQAARWFKRGQQGYEDIGATTELGQLRYIQGMDPDVREMIANLRRATI